MMLRAGAPQTMARGHGAGRKGLWDVECLEVDGGAVVKHLVATAFVQLSLKHQSAVQVKLHMVRAYVQVLINKNSYFSLKVDQ